MWVCFGLLGLQVANFVNTMLILQIHSTLQY